MIGITVLIWESIPIPVPRTLWARAVENVDYFR